MLILQSAKDVRQISGHDSRTTNNEHLRKHCVFAVADMLLGMRRDFQFSRPSLAAFLRVEVSTLKSWKTGKRAFARR
jgi:DNA-binding transcriptional regulator YiaG